MREINVNCIEDTMNLGEKLGDLLKPGCLITLSGDLGAGKTTFTKSIGKSLGVKKVINSPTFTILKSYYGKMPLHHIDAYRLEGITQDLGFEELFEDDGVCIIEWPDFILDQLPMERLDIEIRRIDDEKRLFLFNPIGETYEKIVREL